MKSLRRLLLALSLLALPAFAQSSDVIMKAREYLGGNSALEAVKSVHYHGQLESISVGADGQTRTDKAEIEIIFAKPFYQRIVITTPLEDLRAPVRDVVLETAAEWGIAVEFFADSFTKLPRRTSGKMSRR